VEDPLDKAQAIVVLSGRIPMEAKEAAHLYHAAYAPQVWLTRANEPAASLQEMHSAYLGDDFFNSRVLVHEGVPSNAIRVLEPPIGNTADEVRAMAAELEQEKGATVIIVALKAHTRRVRTLWRELTGGRGRAIVRAASTDPICAGPLVARERRCAGRAAGSAGPSECMGGAVSASFALRGQSEKEKPLAPERNHFIGNFRDMRKVASFKGGQRVFEK
jgi:hypothetical protein